MLTSESPQDITGAPRDVRSGKECVRKRDGGAIGEGGASRCQQIALGLDAEEFCRLDQAIEKRGGSPRANCNCFSKGIRPSTGYAVFFSFVFWAIFGTFSTTETGGRLGCNHRMSLECLAIRWHKS